MTLSQTNLQLYAQMERAEYARAEIERVARAYELAKTLFSGAYRSTGKTFVAHLVGTASALVAIGARTPLVVAGLLHAAYAAGDFGTIRRRPGGEQRARVRDAAGAEAESLIWQYTRYVWPDSAAAAALARYEVLTAEERDVIVLRLANEVDEHADGGAWYSKDWERRVAFARETIPVCERLATALGEPALASILRELVVETCAWDRPLVDGAFARSQTIAPASLTPRLHVRLRRIAYRLSEAVRRRWKLAGRSARRRGRELGP